MTIGFVTLFITLNLAGKAQFDPSKVCKISDNRLVFTLDNRWNQKQIKEIGTLYSLDSVLLADAFSGRHVINDSGIVWMTRKLDENRFELYKNEPLTERSANDFVFLLEDETKAQVAETERESVPYGYNKMTRNNITPFRDHLFRFFLPGFRNAGKVYLAGSFNGWSTNAESMIRSDSGWATVIRLLPGKYSYKYIVDGVWISDPFNYQTHDDTYGGDNSIWFVYNYQFTLDGFSNARSVFVAGSFNNWKPGELKMFRINGKWRYNLYLREGTHAYKFLVDGQWITDPANKLTRPDGSGNLNSFMCLGDTLYFSLKGFPKAEKVAVAGNFNGWNPNELFMVKVRGGWELPYVLAAGNYEYKFLVDGKWIIDPDNPNTTGSGDYTNSVLTVKPNHTFRLEKFLNAKEVCLTGTFNGWSKSGYLMTRRNNAWVFPIRLKPGKYLYKFVVDGKYILDPGNELWEENEYGTGNSVVWINP